MFKAWLALGIAGTVCQSVGAAVPESTYPNKPIRLVSSGIGSSSDQNARLIAQGISEQMGQPIVIDNRDGSVTPGTTVAQAAPDGYTILFTGGTFWVSPLVQKTPYDPIRDFAPITLAVRTPKVLVVHPSLPVNSVKELIAYAKSKPGGLVYASSGVGATSHIAVEQFSSMAGIKMLHVPFKANSMLMTSLMSGETQLAINSPAGVMGQVKAGKLKALAVTSLEPSALVPGLPTVSGSGLPGYVSETLYGLFAPARTSPATVRRLQEEVARFFNQPNVKKKFFDMGGEAVGNKPEEFAATIKSEVAQLGKVIKDIGLKPE